MLEKIKFHVAYCSSEDAGYAGSELEKHGPTIDGWRSAKSATQLTTPNEIILKLESRAKLGHAQILTHQYLIPEKIELYIGEILDEIHTNLHTNLHDKNSLVDHEKIQFVTLGHVNLSTNLNTGFKVRELKSISLECTGTFVKILVYQNHINKYNRYNQVSLVALNLLGEKQDDDDINQCTRSLSHISFHETTQNERDKHLFSPYDDLAFTMYVDNDIQDLVRKLDQKKQEAILDERFDFASKLKATMEHLRKSGEVLAKYQLEKKIAAGREDFQRAKEKKIQADSYRENLYKSFRINQLLEPNGRLAENDEPKKITGYASMSTVDGHANGNTGNGGMTRSMTEMTLPFQSIMSTVSTPESTVSERFSSSLLSTPTPENLDADKKQESGYFSSNSNAEPVLESAPPEPKFPPLYLKKRRPLERIERELREERTSSAVRCQLRPSNMSERAKRYAALPIAVFGEFLVEKLFSKNFAVKEDGLRNLQKALSDYRRGDKNNPPSKIFRAAIILLQRTIKDIVFSVFHSTILTIQYLLDDFSRKHRLPGSELNQGLERILPDLISKSGDTTLGKNKIAVDCIMKLQTCHHIQILNVIPINLTKPFDTPAHPRLAQSKTEMVEELFTTYGITNEKNTGMTPRDYVEFSVSAFNQPSESVRRVAERLIINLYHKHARLVRQYLPLEEDVSPKNIQYRHLFQQFDKIDRERKHGDPNFCLGGLKDSKSPNALTSSIYIPNLIN